MIVQVTLLSAVVDNASDSLATCSHGYGKIEACPLSLMQIMLRWTLPNTLEWPDSMVMQQFRHRTTAHKPLANSLADHVLPTTSKTFSNLVPWPA
jgi:hypothetical protein